MAFLSGLGNTLLRAAKSFETIVQHPIQSIKTIGNQASFNALSEKTNAQPLTKQIGNILLSTGTAAAAVVAGGAALGSTTARAIGSGVLSSAAKLVPSTTKGKVIAAVAAPVAASAVISNPGGALTTVSKTVKAQIDLGKTIANPSLSAAEKYVTEHPGASIALGAAALAAVGGGLGLAANTLATFSNSAATRANTAAGTIPESAISADLPVDSSRLTSPQVISPSTSAPTAPTTAITPATQTITNAKTSVTRKKHYKKLTIAPISQRVNVIVSNRSIGTKNNTYLNRRVYA